VKYSPDPSQGALPFGSSPGHSKLEGVADIFQDICLFICETIALKGELWTPWYFPLIWFYVQLIWQNLFKTYRIWMVFQIVCAPLFLY
jgi:hypothetical protein